MSKLENILQEEVLAEINAILSEAETGVVAIVREAEEEVARHEAARKKTLELERQVILKRAASTAELTLATARMKARGEMIDEVHVKVQQQLDKVHRRKSYNNILTSLAEEALGAVGQAEVVVVSPADRNKLLSWAEEKRLLLHTDPDLRLGVRMVATGGKSQVENTLFGRLERAWDDLSAEASRLLWS